MKQKNDMDIRSKFWIEIDGEPVFGRGRLFLLEAIDTHDSINQAAKEINISYRKAWSYIKTMEERLGLKLVERHTGGRYGGGAALTDNARQFILKYRMMEEGLREIVDERFTRIFGSSAGRTADEEGDVKLEPTNKGPQWASNLAYRPN